MKFKNIFSLIIVTAISCAAYAAQAPARPQTPVPGSPEYNFCRTKDADSFLRQVVDKRIYGNDYAWRVYILSMANPKKRGRNRFEDLKFALGESCKRFGSIRSLQDDLKENINTAYRNMLNDKEQPTFPSTFNKTRQELEALRPN